MIIIVIKIYNSVDIHMYISILTMDKVFWFKITMKVLSYPTKTKGTATRFRIPRCMTDQMIKKWEIGLNLPDFNQ